MQTKAAQTRKFIIETVAPIFNKKGYIATTMSDITQATHLTKGAIYGNFENKDELAMEAFTFNVKKMLRLVDEYQASGATPLEKLFLGSQFYRSYYDLSRDMGGCPILNMGVSTKEQHPVMYDYVKFTVNKIISNLQKLIEEAQILQEIKPEINPAVYAQKIYTLFQGAIFMAHTLEDPQYLTEASKDVDNLLHQIKT